MQCPLVYNLSDPLMKVDGKKNLNYVKSFIYFSSKVNLSIFLLNEIVNCLAKVNNAFGKDHRRL